MDFQVRVDVPPALRSLSRLKREQIPFATSRALNEIGKLGREDTTKGIFERFDVRRPQRIKTSVKQDYANKRTLRTVLTVRDPFLAQHEEGGIRRPGDIYSSIAQPIGPVQRRRKVIRGKNTPKALLAEGGPKIGRPKGSKGGRSQRQLKRPTPFIAKMKSGKVGVFKRRKKRGRLPIDLLFTFEKAVKISPRLEFQKTVLERVSRSWEPVFGREFARAIATAR